MASGRPEHLCASQAGTAETRLQLTLRHGFHLSQARSADLRGCRLGSDQTLAVQTCGFCAAQGPGTRAAYRRDISHSCRSPASAARCSGSIVPAVLSVPNTGLRQPHVQTAWTPPSPSSWMVVWWSTATGSSKVNDRAGHRAPHAVERLDPGGYELGKLVDLAGLRPRNDVVGPGGRQEGHPVRDSSYQHPPPPDPSRPGRSLAR